MAAAIGSAENPLRVAIFGSGPAGFYAAEALLKAAELTVRVDMYDRLPTPYGLVRGGVAPDHQKIKSVIRLFERTAQREGFRFFGNVTYGQDVQLDDLLRHYHQVLFCTGSETDRRMDIPGEDLAGSHPATAFVGWYNGHPDYQGLDFGLEQAESVAVVGNGNVAVDVVRILAKDPDELAGTDIAEEALEALRRSRVRTIWMLGRRGPAQAAFTNPEVRELTQLESADFVVEPAELELDEHSQAALAESKDPTQRRNVEILNGQVGKSCAPERKCIRARFFVSPVEVQGSEAVEGLRLERNVLEPGSGGRLRAVGTGEYEEIPVQLVFRSIGYHGVALPGLPFDARAGIIPNAEGRVIEPDTGATLARLYVAGWIKRGPSGVIGTNKGDAIATVQHMLEDLDGLGVPEDFDPAPEAPEALLAERGVRIVTFGDWQRLDQVELERGSECGKVRQKFTSVDAMLEALG